MPSNTARETASGTPPLRRASDTSASVALDAASDLPGDHAAEVRVDASVAGHLGMERGREQRPLAHGDDMAVVGGAQRGGCRPDLLHPRRADEHGVERIAL